MSQRPPCRAGTAWLSVTRPMTVPSLMRGKIRNPKNLFEPAQLFRAADFGFPLDFGFRISDLSYGHPRFFFVDDPGDHPARGAAIVTDHFARGQAVRGNHDPLMHSRAVRIDCDLRSAFGLSDMVDRLANNQTPPF